MHLLIWRQTLTDQSYLCILFTHMLGSVGFYEECILKGLKNHGQLTLSARNVSEGEIINFSQTFTKRLLSRSNLLIVVYFL